MKTCFPLFLGLFSFAVGTPHRQAVDECSVLDTDRSRCAAYWGDAGPPLVVVSLDGFRWDYLNKTLNGTENQETPSPIIHLLGCCGVRSEFMVPVFPTITFPNHYSIVTGLYPESHGIVAHDFLDLDLGLKFSLSNLTTVRDPRWWIGESLWYTTKKQGKKSASFFWPGSYIDDPVREPTYWVPYNRSVPFEERISQVLEWLSSPVGQRPKFLTLYLEQPDEEGHFQGPDSQQVVDQITNVDKQLEALLNGLSAQNILGCVDIIVLSDHGMANSPPGEDLLLLEELVPDLLDTTVYFDEVLNTIRPNNDTLEERERIGRAIECQKQAVRVYNKWQFPSRHHYKSGNRIPSLLLDLNLGWRGYFHSEYFIMAGNHGWDNLYPEMQAIFVAQGPSFKKKYEARPFHNIELYNLMCTLIGVEPAPNNGTWGSLHHLLVEPPSDPGPKIPPAPKILAFPADQASYGLHLQRHKCDLLQGINDPQTDSTLNLTEAAANSAVNRNAPWGLPRADDTEFSDLRVLISNDYLTGYRTSEGIASWVSYTVRQNYTSPVEFQYRLDARLEPQHSAICDRLDRSLTANTVLWPLFPPEFASRETDALVDTNLIEIPSRFVNHLNTFHGLLSQAADKREVHVVSGPLMKDPLNPSFFYVAIACNTGDSSLEDCPVSDLNVQSFLLPIKPQFNLDCMKYEKFFVTHLATLRDIETATKLYFLPNLSYADKVSLLSRTLLEADLVVKPVL